MKQLNSGFSIFIFCFLFSTTTFAGFATSTSRIIYMQNDNAQSVTLANINEYPIITQTWIDDGLGNPLQAKAPFVVLPAVFKMNPQGIQALRIVHNGDAMPQDRESVYWLNLYEIPGKPKELSGPVTENKARLDLAMNTQLKIFYRPKTLKKMDSTQIAQQLQFYLQQQQGQTILICHNPTPYHISFTGLSIFQAGKEIQIQQEMDMMTPPLSKRIYHLQNSSQLTDFEKINFSFVNDQGHSIVGKYDKKQTQ